MRHAIYVKCYDRDAYLRARESLETLGARIKGVTFHGKEVPSPHGNLDTMDKGITMEGYRGDTMHLLMATGHTFSAPFKLAAGDFLMIFAGIGNMTTTGTLIEMDRG